VAWKEKHLSEKWANKTWPTKKTVKKVDVFLFVWVLEKLEKWNISLFFSFRNEDGIGISV